MLHTRLSLADAGDNDGRGTRSMSLNCCCLTRARQLNDSKRRRFFVHRFDAAVRQHAHKKGARHIFAAALRKVQPSALATF